MDSAEGLGLEREITRRRPWVIVLLAVLFSSFVFVYCGRLRRAVAWFFIKWIAFLFAVAVMLYTPNGRVAVFGGVAILIGTILAVIFDALGIAKQQSGKQRRRYQRWWTYLFLIVAFGFADSFLNRGVVDIWMEAFILPTNGMRETLLPGDRFLVDKLVPRFGPPRREQIAVFYPSDRLGELYVQRVVGLAGDRVEIEDNNVLVNGEPIEQQYARFIGDEPNLAELEDFGPVTVPESHFFALGDNRWRSRDSRFHGFVSDENYVGIARVIFWSREREFVPPNRKNPEGRVTWGEVRIERIGKLIQ